MGLPTLSGHTGRAARTDMEPELRALTIEQYELPVVDISCTLCKRNAPAVSTSMLQKKYGNVTLGEACRLVARARGCVRAEKADQNFCQSRPFRPTIWHWASLDHARRLGYAALLHCNRHFASLKATKPCRGAVTLDLDTLVAVLGHDQKLEFLPSKLQCPSCGTKMIHVEWLEPSKAPSPGGVQEPPRDQRRPAGNPEVTRKTFRVVRRYW